MATRQTISAQTGTLANGGTEYFSPGLLTSPAGTENAVAHPWLQDGEARAIRVELSAAPGLGASRTFAFRKAGSDTTLTLTLADNETAGLIQGCVSFLADDLLSVGHAASGGPAAASAKLTLVVDALAPFLATYGGMNGAAALASGGTTYNVGVFTANGWGNVGSIFTQNLCPMDCTIRTIDVQVHPAPGVGETVTCELYVNDVAQGIGLVVSGTGTSGRVTPDVVLAPNDFVFMRATGSAGAAVNIHVVPTYLVEGLVDGESIVASPGGAENLFAFQTTYAVPRQWNQSLVEANSRVIGGISGMVFGKLYAAMRAGAFHSDPMDITLVVNGTPTALTVQTPLTPGLEFRFAPPNLTDTVAIGGGGGDSFDVELVIPDVFSALAWWAFTQIDQVTDGGQCTNPSSPAIAGVIGPHIFVIFPRTQPDEAT